MLAISLIPVVVMFIGIKYQQWQSSQPSKPNRRSRANITDKPDSRGFIELSGNTYEYLLWPSRPMIYSDASKFCTDRNTR